LGVLLLLMAGLAFLAGLLARNPGLVPGASQVYFRLLADQSRFGELWIQLATEVDELATQSMKPNGS
jgi:hypothetical protein